MRREVLRLDVDPAGAVQALDRLADGRDGLGQAGSREVVVVQGDHGVEGWGVHAAMMRRDGLATGKRPRGIRRRGAMPITAHVILANKGILL